MAWSRRDVKVQVIDRSFLPQFTFDDERHRSSPWGPTAWSSTRRNISSGQPILAINPDPEQIEGVLLPFTIEEYPRALAAALRG